MTFEELKMKYPELREKMSIKREREFVNDCFEAYENEKVANTFWSPYGDHKDKFGMKFSIKSRCTEKDAHISALPMWNIVMEDGAEIGAYPEEVFEREQKREWEEIEASF